MPVIISIDDDFQRNLGMTQQSLGNAARSAAAGKQNNIDFGARG
jgi:hypothetical protein